MARVWRCSYAGQIGGVLVVNTFHVVARPDVGSFSDASADSVRDALHTALTTKYRATVVTAATVDSLTVREETDPAGSAIPEESVQSIGLAGTRAPATTDAPYPECMLVKISSNAAVRSGHGRMWMPPVYAAGQITGTRQWLTTGTYWVNVGTFMDELLTSHSAPAGAGTNTLKLVVYSRTRRARGDANYYFDATGYVRRLDPHWLRSRSTAP